MAKDSTLLHVICDYSPAGMEFGEIIGRIQYFLDEPHAVRIHPTSVPQLDTMAVGFVTAQYAFAPHDGRLFIYGNAAPRRSSNKATANNEDNGIRYAKLDNGVEIVNVNSEFAFGFVKDHIVEYRGIDCPVGGSQFRSRDFFPERVAKLINGDRSVLTEQLSLDEIPSIPNNLVAWVDWFGNIKTTMRKSDLENMGLQAGDKVEVTINDVTLPATVAIGGFAVARGELALNIGSSGYENPFVELFLRVHQMSDQPAAVRFGYPVGATEFTLRRV